MSAIHIRRPRLRSLLPAVLLPTIAAVVATIATAPAAYALTEQQIEFNCRGIGGTCTHYKSPSGEEWSTCCVKNSKGTQDCDYYFNGEFFTTVFGNATPPPIAQPGGPPPPSVAPGAPVMPGQGSQPAQPPSATETPVIP